MIPDTKWARFKAWLFDLNPLNRAYEVGYRDGVESELHAMEAAKIVWTDHRGMIDKPATIKRWRDTHFENWERYGTEPYNLRPIIMREVPHNKHEHERYLELFPEEGNDADTSR